MVILKNVTRELLSNFHDIKNILAYDAFWKYIFIPRCVVYPEKLLSRVNHFPEEQDAFNFANSLREKLPAVLYKKKYSVMYVCVYISCDIVRDFFMLF